MSNESDVLASDNDRVAVDHSGRARNIGLHGDGAG
jgi:hypothetical protein